MIVMPDIISSCVVQSTDNELIASILHKFPIISAILADVFRNTLDENVEPDINKLETVLRSKTNALSLEIMHQAVESIQKRLVAQHMKQFPNSRCQKRTPFYWWTTWGKVEFIEMVFTDPQAGYQRFVSPTLGVTNRGMSFAMKRVAADFGLESSFAHAVERINEHYGFEYNVSAIVKATYETCSKCKASLMKKYDAPANAMLANGERTILAEADGSMLRIVPEGLARNDNRKLDWCEVRVLLATPIGSTETHYAATFGDIVDVTNRWGHTANDAGRGLNSHVHVVADGAGWIRLAADAIFGSGHTFLIDYPHCCGYLHQAAEVCASDEVAAFYGRQKNALLNNGVEDILRELTPYRTPGATPETENGADKAWRYLDERRDCLDYMAAAEAGLPIGSGQIESAHRHVVQERLKGPGKSWLRKNAELMLQARVVRANKLWANLWNSPWEQICQLN